MHVGSADPFASPLIDMKALDNEADMSIMVDAIKFIRKVAKMGPMAEIGRGELLPGEDVQSDEQLKGWIKNTVQTIFHPIGTASMLPRADGGVVDASLRVYGTDNLRVVSRFYLCVRFRC